MDETRRNLARTRFTTLSRLGCLALLAAFSPAALGQVNRVLRDFPHAVDAVAFSPDGKTLATGTFHSGLGRDALRLWDVATGKEMCSLGDNHRFGCTALAFTPDGKTLAANGGAEGELQLWDVATRKLSLTIKVPATAGGRLAVSPDSKILAVSDDGPSVRLYDLQTGKEQRAMEGSFKPLCIAFSPDGKLLAGSAQDGVVVLWDAATGKQRSSWERHKRRVRSVVFAPDGKTLYSLGEDRLLVFWDVTENKERKAVDLRNEGPTWYAALSPDGRTLATFGALVRLFDLEREEYRPGVAWDYQTGTPRCICFSPDGKLLATGSGGSATTNNVYLYDVPVRKDKPPE